MNNLDKRHKLKGRSEKSVVCSLMSDFQINMYQPVQPVQLVKLTHNELHNS